MKKTSKNYSMKREKYFEEFKNTWKSNSAKYNKPWCPHCGLDVDRDLNAAKNILSRVGTTQSYAYGDLTATQGHYVLEQVGSVK